MPRVDREYVKRRLEDWRLALSWRVAEPLEGEDMNALLTLVSGIVSLAKQDTRDSIKAALDYDLEQG